VINERYDESSDISLLEKKKIDKRDKEKEFIQHKKQFLVLLANLKANLNRFFLDHRRKRHYNKHDYMDLIRDEFTYQKYIFEMNYFLTKLEFDISIFKKKYNLLNNFLEEFDKKISGYKVLEDQFIYIKYISEVKTLFLKMLKLKKEISFFNFNKRVFLKKKFQNLKKKRYKVKFSYKLHKKFLKFFDKKNKKNIFFENKIEKFDEISKKNLKQTINY
jgi:hypothetical protein